MFFRHYWREVGVVAVREDRETIIIRNRISKNKLSLLTGTETKNLRSFRSNRSFQRLTGLEVESNRPSTRDSTWEYGHRLDRLR